MTTLDGPVGEARPGSWWRTEKITNYARDQEKLIKLFAQISVNDGGKRETWATPPLAGPDGKCAPALATAIWDFQVFWKGKGAFTNIDGVVDRAQNTIKKMDAIAGGSPAPVENSGSSLAHTDVPRARRKVADAIAKLRAHLDILKGASAGPPDPVVEDALLTHFRLAPSHTSPDPPRWPVTEWHVNHILTHYAKMDIVLALHDTSFVDGRPVNKNGDLVPAASHMDSKQIIFSPVFHNKTTTEGAAIGPESRAAILIHEGYHSVDSAKVSDQDDIHISEYSPKYDVQPASKAIHNPSSYASFAAHVALGRDPNPRYGLGRGRFQ